MFINWTINISAFLVFLTNFLVMIMIFNSFQLFNNLRLLFIFVMSSWKAKIAYFDLAKTIYEQVCRLNVSMDNISRMNELKGAQTVIYKSYNMSFFELSSFAYWVQSFLQIVFYVFNYNKDIIQILKLSQINLIMLVLLSNMVIRSTFYRSKLWLIS